MPSDEEVICEFMEPKPTEMRVPDGCVSNECWWEFGTVEDGDRWIPGWMPRRFRNHLNLISMHEVEARLTGKQWFAYESLLSRNAPVRDDQRELVEIIKANIHASAAQKIAALASVLREAPNAR